MSVGTIEDAESLDEPSSEPAIAALSGAAKNERRVLAATLVAMASLIGALLFATHVTMQHYVVRLGPWFN